MTWVLVVAMVVGEKMTMHTTEGFSSKETCTAAGKVAMSNAKEVPAPLKSFTCLPREAKS
jgi:hypothetical protein